MVEVSPVYHIFELSTTVVLQPVAGAAYAPSEAINTVAGKTIANAIKITIIVFRLPIFSLLFLP
jgi:hypothetical protein